MKPKFTDSPPSRPRLRLAAILAVFVLSACRLFSPAVPPATPASLLPSATLPAALPTATLPAPAASPTTVPTMLPTIAPATLPPPAAPPVVILPTLPPVLPTAVPPRPTLPPPAPTHPDTLRLKIFMIATGDNGASGKMIGCGDSVIPVNIDVPYTQGVLRASLERLLAHKSQFYGESGLYNALYQSDLRIDGLNIKNGEAIIQLSGRVTLGGECDTPRLIAQIEETALQFSTVQRVSVFLNGEPIREALSQRGS